MASGDNLTAGRTRNGESTTGVLGGRPDELDVPFNGTVVFSAGPRTDDQRPDTPVCGLRGVGWNGGDGFIPTAGGCGVLGFGAAQMGTGIIGLGGGARHAGPFITWTMADGPEGAGGVGVFGRGGDGLPLGHQSPPDPLLFNPSPPGAGVVGRGGTSRFPAPGPAHGAGVIGVAGGVDEAAFPTLAEAGNVGVFGQGGTASEQLAGVTIGAPEPGPGVVGHGGAPAGSTPAGSGVVGVAGNRALPPAAQLGDCGVIGLADSGPGVYGEAPRGPGVRGLAEGGPGVRGESVQAQGGVFSSARRAQLHLVPLNLTDPNGAVPGEGGDLLAARNKRLRGIVSLWFCVFSGDATGAVWVKIA